DLCTRCTWVFPCAAQCLAHKPVVYVPQVKVCKFERACRNENAVQNDGESKCCTINARMYVSARLNTKVFFLQLAGGAKRARVAVPDDAALVEDVVAIADFEQGFQ